MRDKKFLKKRQTVLCVILILTGLLCSCAAAEPPATAALPEVLAPYMTNDAGQTDGAAVREKDRDIDFGELQARNRDITAVVEVPGTDIDYPVVYSFDNNNYLRNDLDGNYYIGGTIFLDMANTRGFVGAVTVIYGHNMPDGTEFTQLHRYKDADYFLENREIKIFTPEHQFNYEIVAALSVDNRYIFYNDDENAYTAYTHAEDMQYFVDWITESAEQSAAANITPENLTVNERFLVLSTCTQFADSPDRFVVVGRLKEII